MSGDPFMKLLEDHFESLRRLVIPGLVDAVNLHLEALQSYVAESQRLNPSRKAPPDSESAIKRQLHFHQTSQDICNSLFTDLSAETPLTSLLSDIKKEHASIDGRIPDMMSDQKIQARQLYRQFLLPEYLERLARLIHEIRREISASLTELLKGELKQAPELPCKERYEMLLGDFFSEHREAFEDLLVRSGSSLSFTAWKIRLKKGKLNKGFAQIMNAERLWRSTFFAFYEDWRFHEHLMSYIQEVRLLHLEVTSILSTRIRTTLYPELEQQKTFIKKVLDGLPDPDTASMEELRSYLVKELYKMNKELKQQKEEEKSEFEAAESIPGILQKLESVILEKLEGFPARVGVVYAADYKKGIKQSEIRYFSPGEFLEFNSLSSFIKVNTQLKSDLGKLLDKIIREFMEFDQIVDFYIDTGISLTQKPGIKEEEVVSVFREGLKRLEGISDRSRMLLEDLEAKKWNEISANVEAYITSVSELDDNDNILNIYTRLLKSKALASSVQNRKRVLSGLKKAANWLFRFVSQHSRWLRASYEDIRKRLKLTSSSAALTSEISNYLAGIRNRMMSLPVTYQYLFDPAPVKEQNLFLSREEDTAKLNLALSDWEKDNFAASLVTGEAGSGCSSLLLHYARTLKSPYPVLSFHVDKFYFSMDDFYGLMGEIFKQDNIRDEASLHKYISSQSEKIVIIDGLERMFMRKVNGFDCLRRFLSLVVNTNERIFWICSVRKTAYHYLIRTVSLSDHFDYILDIDHLDRKDIREIIMKRNRLSGYAIQFLNSAEEAAENGEVVQEELESEFFSDLDRFAGSNIGLSLIYWLQSVESVNEDGIKVGKFAVPDFEFLGNLPAKKAYALLLVVLHGKISESYHALACNCSKEESSSLLSILREDAILIRKGEYFFLNGILYRHVIKLLKDRNLIH